MLIIPALVLVLAFSLLITAALRPPGRPATLLSVYLLAYANIVLVGEITNTFYQLSSSAWWLALHSALAATAWLVWRLAGKPSLSAPWKDADGRILPGNLRSSGKSWPELWLLGIGVAGAYLFNLYLLWIMPPNNNDSLATHMSRVAYWLQRSAFFPWPTQRVWQVTYPVNMQLQMFWTVLFIGSDRLVEIVQWLGALAAMTAVFGLARLLGASRAQSLFAALVWATFPEIILESTTTQNDLVAGTLFAAMLYLLFLGLKTRRAAPLVLAGLALGLGLGTKQTLIFLLPGLALAAALVLVYEGKRGFRGLLIWGACSLAAFALVGAYTFAVNQVFFGHPMGPETAVEQQTGGQSGQSLWQNLVYNSFRLAYQSIDPTGLPDPLTGYGFKLKALVVSKITQAAGFPVEAPVAVAARHAFVLRERYVVQEDAAWYGPLLALLVIPGVVIQLIAGMRRKHALRVSIPLLGITFLLADAAFRPGWDPFQGRYFIPVVTVAAPCMAFLFQSGRRGIALRVIVAALALVIAGNTILLNSGKPVNGQKAIWGSDWLDRVTMQSFYMRKPARMVEKWIPADSTLGLLTYGTFLEYPFFREDYSRRLVQIFPPERAQDTAWLQQQGIEYVLVETSPVMPVVTLPGALVPVASDGDWTIYAWGNGFIR